MSTRKLTPAQWRMLDRICRTNGGGIHIRPNSIDWNVAQRLYEMDLVQGKSGTFETAVHTRDGLQLWRSKRP